MVDQETYEELKESLENTQMAIRSGRPRYALQHVAPLLDALFDAVFVVEEEEVKPEPELVSDSINEEEEEEELPTVEELVDGNKRDQLDEMAVDLGIEDPGSLSTKSDVAEAIVAARG